KAYEYYRDEFLRANFEIIVIGLFVLIVLILVYGKLKKKKIIAPISAYIAVGFMKIKESLKKKPKKEEE
ncbi:MAG: hypothetical protein IJ031_01955, partial [Oscillospiraceae bacterium]|nr:hypothetical protein [Oscillospiraceae bacterium]